MSNKILKDIRNLEKELFLTKVRTVIFKCENTVWNTVITPKKLELVRLIRGKKPKNVSELAFLSKRKIENVQRDLKMLEHFHIVKLKKRGRETVPTAAAEEIVISFK